MTGDSATSALDRAQALVHDIAARLSAEADLDDFLGWWGGTPEHWIHICAAAVARRTAWAARSEVPYITAAPAASAKTPVQWADGAVVWAGGDAALLEVKTIPHRDQLGGAVTAIPTDLAALVAADQPATLAHHPETDRYTDNEWWMRRDGVRRLVGIQIALVHGRSPLPDPDEAIAEGISRGERRMLSRFRNHNVPPSWSSLVKRALQ